MSEKTIDSWTLSEAQEMLTEYKAALKAIASGKSYSIGDRSLTRANETFIKQQIHYFARIVDKFNRGKSGGPRIFRAVPRDL